MNKLIVSAAASLLIALPALAGTCGGKATSAKYTEGHLTKGTDEKATSDIVDTAAAAGRAGLVDALKGEGPLTVFAPTDAAFAALPAGTVETLLKPENKDQLAAILKLHVIPGKVKSKDLAGKTLTAETLGGTVAIDGTNGVKVNDATVTTADIKASNGIIHVIDKVLLPAS